MPSIPLFDQQASNFQAQFEALLLRGEMDLQTTQPMVQTLLEQIKKQGLDAILSQVQQFDFWQPTSLQDLCISQEQMQEAYEQLNPKLKESLLCAYERIYAFHAKQKPKSWIDFEQNGNILGQKLSPIHRVGLYIPGGKAAYPSSLLMNAIPAIVAGVKEIVVCTPTPNNAPNQLLLSAMHICHIKQAYKVGGATAIGMLAYGLHSDFERTHAIAGPGNIFVATAKKLVFGEVKIDMIAGPSEIGIIADQSARADYIAMDLLSQAEHDEMASSILITTSKTLANEVSKQINNFLPKLPRFDIASKSIYKRGAIILTPSLQDAINLMNKIAPEHLELLISNPLKWLPSIQNAGAIFLGEHTPEAIGDYLAGPNHTLPTGGSAKAFSPLSTEFFMKKSSIIAFSQEAMQTLGHACEILADAEGLEAHKQSITLRLRNEHGTSL